MSPVPTFSEAAAKGGDSHPIIAGGQGRFLRPGIRATAGTAIARRIAPTYPVGLMVDSVVGKRELGSGNQVVVRLAGIRRGGSRIAQGHLIIHAQLGPRRNGVSQNQKGKNKNESPCGTVPQATHTEEETPDRLHLPVS